jgi:hypothetical protein
VTGLEPAVEPERNMRRRLLVALAVTAAAVPILLLDNLPSGSGGGESRTTRVVAPASIPADRPTSGPQKGISVVTSSTTSSTLPITITTTTLPG